MVRSNGFALVSSLMLFASLGMAQTAPIAWRTDLDAARAEARQSNRLLLVHFWSPTCGPCKLLERDVFTQPQVATAIEQSYIPVSINASEALDLCNILGVSRIPTDVVMTAEGTVVDKQISPNTPMAYVARMNEIHTKFANQPNKAFNDAVAQSAQFPTRSAGTANSVYAGLNIPATAPIASAPTTAPTTTATAPAVAPVKIASQPPVVASATPAPMPTATTAPAPGVVENTHVQPPVPAAPTTPAEPAAPAASPVASQLPPGTPPLCFDGYCPVTMKKEWRWQAGDVRFGAVHRNRTYLFSSPEAQQEFLRDPDGYSPVLSGADPVLAIDSQQTVPGKRSLALQYENQFYLFSSQETLTKFRDNARNYSQGVRQAMAAPTGQILR